MAIVALSYVFYSGGDPFFVLLLALSSCIDYRVALNLHQTTARRRRLAWLTVSISVNLVILATFKYGTMIVRNTNPLLSAWGHPEIAEEILDSFILPAGISFYTFQTLSYTIDVYRGTVVPTRDFAGFLSYVAYLPQLIAGPIERFNHLYPQLRNLAAGTAPRHWSAGIDRLSLGIAQKLIIADGCGRIVDLLATVDGAYDFATAWLLALGFGMQIYFDFAGYTNMAIGVSLLFGVRLSENFLSPYRAASIQEFWRRWHVTLSNWFRDYLYFSLGGSRSGHLRAGLNLILTMALCGLWHGAGWNYVAWGLGHGLLLAGHRVWRTTIGSRLPTVLGAALTFAAVHFLWVPFRVSDPNQVVSIWIGMLSWDVAPTPLLAWDLMFVGAIMIGAWVAPNCAERWPGRGGPLESFVLWTTAVFAILTSPQIHQFIYFRF